MFNFYLFFASYVPGASVFGYFLGFETRGMLMLKHTSENV